LLTLPKIAHHHIRMPMPSLPHRHFILIKEFCEFKLSTLL
jgi:hypothetical protein